MQAERWQEVQELFDAALEVEVDRRRDFVREQDAEPSVAAEVLEMLAADQELGRDESEAGPDFLARTVLAGQTLVSPPPRAEGGSALAPETASEAATVLRASDSSDAGPAPVATSPLVPRRSDLSDGAPDFGKYRLVEKVGEGGFGQVYRARDPLLGRDVAIKTCTSGDDRLRHRFLREAKISAGLQHANIVTVFDFGYHGDIPYLVQEFLDGEDLSQLIARQEGMAIERIETILLDIARGLAHAHDHGVLHRDVKPGNIRVLPAGQIKILDFGIARLRDHKSGYTSEGVTLGTVGYLSPEQLSGGAADERSDIFSFGVMAYELLCFEKPFTGETFSQVSYKLLFEKPIPLGKRVENCPPALTVLVECCLAKKPAARYASFHKIIRELERILEHSRSDGSANQATQILPVPPPARRRWPAALGLVAVALALAAAFAAWRGGPDAPPAGASSTVAQLADEITSEDAGPDESSQPATAAVDSPPSESPAELSTSVESAPSLAVPSSPTQSSPNPSSPIPAQAAEIAQVTGAANPEVGGVSQDRGLDQEAREADPIPGASAGTIASSAGSSDESSGGVSVEPAQDTAPLEPALQDTASLESASRDRAVTEPSLEAESGTNTGSSSSTVENDASSEPDHGTSSADEAVAGGQVATGGATQDATPDIGKAEMAEVQPKLIERAEPDYPPLARRRRLEATVSVLAFVGPAGSVDRTLVQSSSTAGVGFEEAALEAARRCRFEPGTRNGRPDGFWKELIFEFSLR